MPKCPKCGAEISELINWCETTEKYRFYLRNGQVEYEHLDTIPSDGGAEWECPVCNQTLFTDEEEAANFLRANTVKCVDCGRELNPVEALFSEKSYRCGDCIRKLHKETIGR